ncbi:prevent-host-death family protein [Halopolyspora algeriensis]|uniref:Prevent-host-death family protein n=1 Tax=Halopolyspora algeriensis TaxID=1500506 RepID=A0A368VIS8_9ACTN|nr:prevent-host-death protein [Halopolyspora algeriensis]RCW40269.1 prevent-host-death family protein [Halopolyspora algeriensis]TQM46250.1 prevent-host-death family protein [Halopolyspora algeriensis]
MTVIPDDQRPLSEVVAELPSSEGRIDVTHNGEPVATVVSTEYLESLEETLAVASDPELVTAIAEGTAELDRGETVPLDEVMAEFGVERR